VSHYQPHRGNHTLRNRLLAVVGIAFAIAVLAALLSGGDSDSGSGYSDGGAADTSYSETGYSDTGYSDESGDSQFYGDGENSIVVTEDGVTIYSDDNGNSISIGG
jgi:hypothetical protein